MDHIPLTSGNLKSAGYDPATRVLEVTFANGGTYQYADVDAEHFHMLQAQSSPGSYFHQHVRNSHRATKVN